MGTAPDDLARRTGGRSIRPGLSCAGAIPAMIADTIAVGDENATRIGPIRRIRDWRANALTAVAPTIPIALII